MPTLEEKFETEENEEKEEEEKRLDKEARCACLKTSLASVLATFTIFLVYFFCIGVSCIPLLSWIQFVN